MIPIPSRNRLAAAQAMMPMRQPIQSRVNPFGPNPFGVNTPPPDNRQFFDTPDFSQPPPYPIQEQPQEQGPPDFASEYAKLTGNRPNKLAYQQAVQEGEPVINRGKWAKLGALLAAGGTSLGQNSAQAGMNLGLSAYQEPQRQATERYRAKVAELANAANMESGDISDQVKALEMRSDQFYKGKDLGLREKAEERATKADEVQARATDAQIRNMAIDNIIPIEKEDGNTYLYDKGTNQERLVGKTGPSAKEKIDTEIKKFSREESVRGYYQKLHDERVAASSLADVNAAGESREEVARLKNIANAEALVAKLKARAATSTGQAREQELALIDAITSDKTLANFNLDQLVEKVGGIYKIRGDETTFGEGRTITDAKDKLRAILERKPVVTTPAGNTGITRSGGKYVIEEDR